ncbi:putative ribonuclease H-like domain-containing protein [Tanacetum coccineum]
MASLRSKLERLITVPLHTLHMDLFGPTSVKSINHASYCLVITDDCTRFSWVFFLASKDETSGILQTFIRQIENQLSHRVKIIRSDNGTEFKNRDMLEFCGNKGIKQEYSTARTPQQNGVAERMNRTLIEAARTMLADSLLPTTFWAEAVSTACYIFNRDKNGMFDIDYLSDSMNYIPVSLENQANPHAGASEVTNNAGTPTSIASEEKDEEVELIVVPSAVRIPEEKDESRTSSTNSKKEVSSTDSLEDKLRSSLFRRELDEVPLKNLGRSLKTTLPVLPQLILEEPKKIAEALQDDSWVQASRRTSYISSYNNMGSCRSNLWNEGDCTKWYTETKENGIDEEVYVSQPPGFVDPDHPNKVYKVVKACMDYTKPLELAEILKKFDTCECESYNNPNGDKEAFDTDEAAMIVDVTPKISHLNAVKRIFKYLKGKPNLGLWYPRESPFDLEAFSDSDYGGSNLDRKSTTGGCQFLGQRLISWQCKKQTIVATSTTEAEYVAAANCCGQV